MPTHTMDIAKFFLNPSTARDIASSEIGVQTIVENVYVWLVGPRRPAVCLNVNGAD